MIYVQEKPEPPKFDKKVRQPGLKALAGNPKELPDHWKKCLPDLYRAYDGICAYVCVLIPPITGGRSVEHFAPKSKDRKQAYEWSNFRLVCSVMNSRKRDFEDVLDPFTVKDDWFVLELLTMEVAPAPHLKKAEKEAVEATIARLKLNDRDCRDARLLYYDAYLAKDLGFERLKKWSPFVAREVERQGLTTK